MSQGTSVVYNPLERILSADLNIEQTMSAAWASNQERAALLSGYETFTNGIGTAISRRGIIAGFEPIVSAAANTLEISGSGAVWSRSTTFPVIPPADVGFSTPWRFAQVFETVGTRTFALPVAGSFRWYLLEARVTNAAPTTAFRDIKNTVTGLFVPTLVTVSQAQTIEFQLVAGTAAVDRIPKPTGGEWVPISAARAVAGGGVVPSNLVYDVRRLPSDVQTFGRTSDAFARGRFDFTSNGGTGAGNRLINGTSVEPHRWFGVEMRASYPNVDIFTELCSSGYALGAADELSLYAIAPLGIAPVRLDKPTQRGLFVASLLAPDRSGFGGGTDASCWVSGVGLGVLHDQHFFLWTDGAAGLFGLESGIYLGLVKVNAAADGFDPMSQVDGHVEATPLTWVDTVAVDGAKTFALGIPVVALSARCGASFASGGVKTGVNLNGGALAGWYNDVSIVLPAVTAPSVVPIWIVPEATTQSPTFVVTTFPAGADPYTLTMWLAAFDW